MKSLFFEPMTEYRAVQNLLIFKLLELLDPKYDPEKIPNYFTDDSGIVDLIRIIPSRRYGACLPREAQSPEIKNIPYNIKVFFIETKPILGKVYYEESLVGDVPLRLNLALRIASEHIDIYPYLSALAKEARET